MNVPVVQANTATEVEFDRRALSSRGLDPALADLFRNAPRFAPGRQRVSVLVNGRARGQFEARFDADGNLIVDLALLKAVGLRTPSSFAMPEENSSFNLRDVWPQATVRPEPGLQRLHLVLPADAVDEQIADRREYQRGGAAALLNYDFTSSTLLQRGRRRTFHSAYTEAGFNAGGWMFRSRQSFDQGPAGSRLNVQESYAERSLPEQRKLLRLGHVSTDNPLFPGLPIDGLQLIPETALDAEESALCASVEGIASSEARVEIRQSGMLLHSTLVPPGPFSLSRFSLRDPLTDLEVTVYEQEGERHFHVPAASFNRATLARPGLTIAAGRTRQFATETNHLPPQAVFAVSDAWRLRGTDGVVSAGVLMTERYHAVAIGLDQAMHRAVETIVSTRLMTSSSSAGAGHAFELRASTSHQGVRANVGVLRQGQRYSSLQQFLSPPDELSQHRRTKWQASVGIGISTISWGTFGVSWSPRRNFAGVHDSRLSGTWSRRFGRSLLSLNLQTRQGGPRHGTNDRDMFLSWSLPLDSGSLRTSLRRSNDRGTFAVDATGRVSPNLSWRSALEQTHLQARPRVSLGADLQTRQARTSASISLSDTSTHINLKATGGVVLHRQGIVLSPHPLQHTFGIARIGNQGGVRIFTDGGSAWTNHRGYAALPRIRPYASVLVQIDGTTLPRRVDLHNGARQLHAARGAVPTVEFRTQQTRRVYVTARMEHEQPLEKGLAVLANGEFVTAVVDRGRIFLPDVQPGTRFEVQLNESRRCTLELQLPDESANDAFFEEGSAICRA